jgi:CBS domain-containing protein
LLRGKRGNVVVPRGLAPAEAQESDHRIPQVPECRTNLSGLMPRQRDLGDLMSRKSPKLQRLTRCFSPAEVVFPEPGTGEEAILRQILERMEKAGRLESAADTLAMLIDRRCCSIVPLVPDVVVVHTKVKGVRSIALGIALARSDLDGQCLAAEVSKFRALIVVISPLEEPSGYMRVLTALRKKLVDPDSLKAFLALEDADAVWRFFDGTGDELPAYISAGDIMHRELRVLLDTDSLSRAIDAFCQYDLDELPVIDKDGDLVGVVSEDELLRICLPEYVTWVDDLTPILDFEPFAEILRREEQMPLMEIMLFSERYAVVDEKTPAIQVAKIMMRNDIRQVLVTRGRRLVGLISLTDFIRKVLRA